MKEQENIQKEQKKSFQFNTNCQTVQVQYSPPRHNLQLIEIVVYNHNQNHAYRFKFSQQNLYQQKELHERYSCLREFYDELQESLYSQPGDPSLSMQIPEISQMILRFKRKNRSRGEIKLKGRKILLKSEEMIETKLRHMGQKISQNQRQIKKLKEKTQSKDAQVFRMKGESNLMKKDLQSFTSEYQNFKKQVHSCLKQVCTYIFNPKKQIQNLQDQIKLKLDQLRTYLSNQRTEFIEASLHSEEEILIKVKSITERLQKIEQNTQLKNLRTQIYESKNTLQLGLEKLNRQFQNKIKHDFIQLAKDSNEFSREVDQRLKSLENKVWTNFQSFKQEQIRQKELQKKEELQKTVPKNAQNSEKQYSLPRVCLFNQQLGQFIKQPLKKYDFVKLQFKKNKSLVNIPNIRSKSTYFHDLIGFKDKKIVSYSISIERTDRFRIALGIVQHKNMEICTSNSQAIEKAYFLDLEKGAFFNYGVIQNYVLKQDIGRSISLSINPQKQKAIWSSKEDILEIQDLGNLLQTNQLRMFILLTDFRDEIQVKRQYR